MLTTFVVLEILNPNIEIRNLDKPDKKKIFYHEITKGRNHEKDHETVRGFQISCFRDGFYLFDSLAIAVQWLMLGPFWIFEF